MSWFNKKKTREEEQQEKIAHSQKLLLEAAVSTADMAQFVTNKLKENLDDAIRQFEGIMAIMSDALLICDNEGVIKACNPAVFKIFGYKATEIMENSILTLFNRHNDVIQTPDELWAILKPEVVQDTIGLTGIRKNKESFPVEVTITRLEKARKSTVMLMLVKDVSDIAALKKEIETTTLQYRSLFELCFDGILIVQNDKIVAANRRAGKMFGVRPESLLEIVFTKLVNQEDREKLEHIDEADEPIEAEALRTDGTPMSLLFSGTDIIWKDEKACLITVRELMPVTKLEKQTNELLDMVCSFDSNFSITYVNEAFWKYYVSSKLLLIGTDIRTLMSETERDAFILGLRCLSIEHPTRHTQVHIDTKLLDWIDHAVYDESGNLIEIQRTGRDITDIVSEVINN